MTGEGPFTVTFRPPAKRARTNAACSWRLPNEVDQGPEDLVLVNQIGWSVKLHKTVLSVTCDMFRGMFQAADASNEADETRDGLPVVRVHETPDQLRFIIPYCYNLAAPKLNGFEFPQLESLLNCAVKYGNTRAIEAVCSEMRSPRHVETNAVRVWELGQKCDIHSLAQVAQGSASLSHNIVQPFDSLIKGDATVSGVQALHVKAVAFCESIALSRAVLPKIGALDSSGDLFAMEDWYCSSRHPALMHTDMIQEWSRECTHGFVRLFTRPDRHDFETVFFNLTQTLEGWQKFLRKIRSTELEVL